MYNCPMCGTVGALVNSKTVEHLSINKFEDCFYAQEIFSLCMDPICEMAYFSADYGYLLLQREIKVPLDYKDEATIKYACYCHEITIDHLRHAVLKEYVKTAKEFFKYQKPIIVEHCKTKNPFGCCCVPDVQKMIEDILRDKA